MNSHLKKTFFLLLWIAVWATAVYAQGDGKAGLLRAEGMIKSYFDPAVKLIYAIGAVVGLVGAIKTYNKFSSGDPDTGKTAASWFGSFFNCSRDSAPVIFPRKHYLTWNTASIKESANRPSSTGSGRSTWYFSSADLSLFLSCLWLCT